MAVKRINLFATTSGVVLGSHVLEVDVPAVELAIGHVELRQLDKSLTGGSHYDATGFTGFRMEKIWVCPVTLCVLGRYPKYLYVKKV